MLCSASLSLQDATVIPHLMALLSRSRYTQEYICQIFSHCCKVRTRITVLYNVNTCMPSGDVPSWYVLLELIYTHISRPMYIISPLFFFFDTNSNRPYILFCTLHFLLNILRDIPYQYIRSFLFLF